MSLNLQYNYSPLYDYLLLAQVGFFLQCLYWYYYSFNSSTRYVWYVIYLMFPEYCLLRWGNFTLRHPQLISLGAFAAVEPTATTPEEDSLIYSLCKGFDPTAIGSQMPSCVHTIGAGENVICQRDILIAATLNGAQFGCPERLVSFTIVEEIFLPNVSPVAIAIAGNVRIAASLLPLVEFTPPGVPLPFPL